MDSIVVIGSHPDSLLNFRKEMLCGFSRHYKVYACVPDVSTEIIQKLQAINVECCKISLSRTGLSPWQDLVTLFQLIRIIRKTKPKKIISYTSKPVIYGSIAAKICNIPEIYSMITGLGTFFVSQGIKSSIIRFIMVNLYKIALSFNNTVFFQNPDDQQEFSNRNIKVKNSVLINGSGVDVEHFIAFPAPEKISFTMVSRYIYSKGLSEYISAARRVKQLYPEAKFYLVGWFDHGVDKNMQEIVARAVCDRVIENLGKLDDVRVALERTSVFVLPSYREGTPRGVLEAMACGRAIITTDVPGCRETVIPNKNGLLVPVRDINALTNAMIKFVKNPNTVQQMGAESRKIALEKYDVRKVNNILFETMGIEHEAFV